MALGIHCSGGVKNSFKTVGLVALKPLVWDKKTMPDY